MTESDNLVNYTEIAELVGMSRQRVYFLRHNDPKFPDKVGKVRRMEIFDWPVVREYFAKRDRSHRSKGWKLTLAELENQDAEEGAASG